MAALPDLRPSRALPGSVSTDSTTKGNPFMIGTELRARIRRYYYAEHWKIGTITSELNLHPDIVRNAIQLQQTGGAQILRPSLVDPYLQFVRETLEQDPKLRATRIYQMIRDRGYTGSVVQLRRAVARLRPPVREPFLRLTKFPGEQAQVVSCLAILCGQSSRRSGFMHPLCPESVNSASGVHVMLTTAPG